MPPTPAKGGAAKGGATKGGAAKGGAAKGGAAKGGAAKVSATEEENCILAHVQKFPRARTHPQCCQGTSSAKASLYFNFHACEEAG